MKKRKLNYRIHDPDADRTADLLLELAVSINQRKVEKILEEEARIHKEKHESA